MKKLLLLCLLLLPLTTHAQIKDDLMHCESGGNPAAVNTEDAAITGSPSFGLYQFQPKTFLKFGIIYKVFPEGSTIADVMPYIKNPVYNGAVGHGMIKDELYSHWRNCAIQIGVLSG